MDHLPLVGLSILLKEIQLIHQQYIVSNFQSALEKNMTAKQDQNGIDFDDSSPKINIGIFGSI